MAWLNFNVQQYGRATKYLIFLKQLANPPENISATSIAAELRLNDVLVRKDLAEMAGTGRPKTGYVFSELVSALENLLGFDNVSNAVLVGVGHLGKSLLSYPNFAKYGVKIIAAFDSNAALVGSEFSGVMVLDSSKVTDMCFRLRASVGIVAVPAAAAQDVCDAMILGGVKAIWNFAPTNLDIPADTLIRNEDLAASLVVLTTQLEKNKVLKKKEVEKYVRTGKEV